MQLSSTCSFLPCRHDLQERLRVARSAPPIIVTTSRHEMVIQERAQQNDCAAFFWKPVEWLNADRHHRVDHESLARME